MPKLLNHKLIVVTLFALFISVSQLFAASGDEQKLEPARLFTARDGLPNIAKKLQNNEEVTIVFIGGSITVGVGKHGYVKNVAGWFQKNYPRAKIKYVNAGMHGTGSDFGAKRYDRDVLRHDPDLVFIEFAVNDGNRDTTNHMERMIHKTWMKNPETDIVIFYTLHKRHLRYYKLGLLPFTASCHERVAEFYNIPTVGCAYAAAQKILKKEMTWKQFAKDSCHPLAKGYGVFLDAFSKALPELLTTGKPGPHILTGSITPNLQPYPPKLKASPLHVKPFVSKDGEKAIVSYQLPVVGLHWIQEPEYKDKRGQTIWKLY